MVIIGVSLEALREDDIILFESTSDGEIITHDAPLRLAESVEDFSSVVDQSHQMQPIW